MVLHDPTTENGMDIRLFEARALADGGRDPRPDECACRDADDQLPCFVCHMAGFEAPNPDADAEAETHD